MSDPLTRLIVNLNAIEDIVRDLPRVGKRSELKDKADELLRLTADVRKEAYVLNKGNKPRDYTPDFGKLWQGTLDTDRDGKESK